MLLSTSLRLPSTGVRSLIGEIAPGVGRAPRRRVWLARVLALASGAIAAVLSYRALAVWLPAGIVSLASLRASVAGWRTGVASRTLARQFAV